VAWSGGKTGNIPGTAQDVLIVEWSELLE